MHDSTAKKVQKDHNNENEVAVLQPLVILELIVMDSAKERSLRNGDVLAVEEEAVSQISETDALKDLFTAFSDMGQNREGGRKSSIR